MSCFLQIFVCCHAAEGAQAALSLSGTMLGFYPIKVLPSKTAIAPVNPTFLPQVSVILSSCTVLWFIVPLICSNVITCLGNSRFRMMMNEKCVLELFTVLTLIRRCNFLSYF